MIEPGLYRHYKGKFYEVLMIGTHTETEEELVIYRAKDGSPRVWVRPATMFASTIDGGPRFIRVS